MSLDKRPALPTLVCLVIVAALALAGCGGSSGVDLAALATRAADVPPSALVTISAKDLKFDKQVLAVPANTEVTIRFTNEEAALHNVAVYRDESVREKIFAGEIFEGRKTMEYSFTTPAAGVYFFRCDAHPEMRGAFIVR